MKVREARTLQLFTPITISDSMRARQRYGIHAGQTVSLLACIYFRRRTLMVCECEDEHRVDVWPQDARVAL